MVGGCVVYREERRGERRGEGRVDERGREMDGLGEDGWMEGDGW